MAEPTREQLLATYADVSEAMMVQSILESGGVPCRMGDLAGVPAHYLGVFGTIDRSVGVWVLDTDVERATSILASIQADGAAVDEEALAAEALAATAEPFPRPRQAGPRAPANGHSARASGPGWLLIALAAAAAVLVLALLRGCQAG